MTSPKYVSRRDQLNHRANFESDGKLYLVFCAACGRQNYSANVPTGTCTWCGWCDAKPAENSEVCSENGPNDAA